MKVREPVARPLDVVAIEMLLSASQAFVAGVMMYLAVGIWADRGVGVGPVAVILALLALAVGGGWLYWLAGGTGWPMAAANVPTAMFLGFALLLGGQEDSLIQLDALPVLLALAGSGYGIVAGVFLDSPRRWRWDQRQQLRPGTEVPTISETTRAAFARVPRSMPKRSEVDRGPAAPRGVTTSASKSPEASRSVEAAVPIGTADLPDAAVGGLSGEPAATDEAAVPAEAARSEADTAAAVPATRTFSPKVEPIDPDSRSVGSKSRTSSSERPRAATSGEAIELPTSVEPKAQRSPWAWAAPPEWTRDEDEGQPPSSRPGSKP